MQQSSSFNCLSRAPLHMCKCAVKGSPSGFVSRAHWLWAWLVVHGWQLLFIGLSQCRVLCVADGLASGNIEKTSVITVFLLGYLC